MNTWPVHFGFTSSLGHVQSISSAPNEGFDLAATSGLPRGAKDLWGRSGANADGGIPTLVTPIQCSVGLGTSTQAVMQSNMENGFWVSAYFVADVNSSTDYRPVYTSETNGYWACASLWGITMQVELG